MQSTGDVAGDGLECIPMQEFGNRVKEGGGDLGELHRRHGSHHMAWRGLDVLP